MVWEESGEVVWVKEVLRCELCTLSSIRDNPRRDLRDRSKVSVQVVLRKVMGRQGAGVHLEYRTEGQGKQYACLLLDDSTPSPLLSRVLSPGVAQGVSLPPQQALPLIFPCLSLPLLLPWDSFPFRRIVVPMATQTHQTSHKRC